MYLLEEDEGNDEEIRRIMKASASTPHQPRVEIQQRQQQQQQQRQPQEREMRGEECQPLYCGGGAVCRPTQLPLPPPPADARDDTSSENHSLNSISPVVSPSHISSSSSSSSIPSPYSSSSSSSSSFSSSAFSSFSSCSSSSFHTGPQSCSTTPSEPETISGYTTATTIFSAHHSMEVYPNLNSQSPPPPLPPPPPPVAAATVTSPGGVVNKATNGVTFTEQKDDTGHRTDENHLPSSPPPPPPLPGLSTGQTLCNGHLPCMNNTTSRQLPLPPPPPPPPPLGLASEKAPCMLPLSNGSSSHNKEHGVGEPAALLPRLMAPSLSPSPITPEDSEPRATSVAGQTSCSQEGGVVILPLVNWTRMTAIPINILPLENHRGVVQLPHQPLLPPKSSVGL